MTLNNRPPMGGKPASTSKTQPAPVNTKTQESPMASLPSLVEVPNDNVIRRGLDGLAPVLNFTGYKSSYNPANDDLPFEQLFVSTAYEGTELEIENSPLIQIIYTTDLAKALEADMPEDDDSSHILQFFVALTTQQVEESKKSRIHELLSVMSRLLPIGYFGYSDTDGIFYRYSMLSPTKELDDLVVVEIVQMISFYIENAYEKLQMYVGTDKSVEEIVEEFEKGFIQSSRE